MMGRQIGRWRPVGRPVAACAMLVAAVMLGGCRELKLESSWAPRQAAADGVPTEWEGKTTFIESPNVAVSVMNDRDNLYLLLATPNSRLAAEMMVRGLAVWFDPTGGKARTFGIRCPVGAGHSSGRESWTPPGGGTATPERERIEKIFAQAGAQLEIVGEAGPQAGGALASGTDGIEVALAYSGGMFVYELRLPLVRDDAHPYAVGAQAGKPLGLGFEIPEIDRDAMREAMRAEGERAGSEAGGGGPRGRGEGGSGGLGGGPGDGPGGQGGRPEGRVEDISLQVWAKVVLATNP
jgi:hypothetical protein